MSNRQRMAAQLGAEAVSSIEPALALYEMTLETQEEKVLFWGGVFARMGGFCAASVGSGALEAIKQTTEQVTAKVLAVSIN